MRRRTARYAVAIVMLAGAFCVVPGAPFATLSLEDETGHGSGVGGEPERLNDVRERLIRREALRRSLDQQIDELAARIEALRERREQSEVQFHATRAEARALEQRLDHLVPRLLVREAAAERRRAQAAQVLADLAGMSRQVELDSRIRARLLAVSPLMLERLNNASPDLARLDRMRAGMLARHRQLRETGPLLLADHQRLERARLQARRQHEALMQRRAELEGELQALRAEHLRLAGQLLVEEAARMARAEPQADRPALQPQTPASSATGPGMAAVKGTATRQRSLAGSVRALQDLPLAHVMAVAAHRPAELEPELRVRAETLVLPPPAKPGGLVLKADLAGAEATVERTSLGQTATVDVTMAEPGALTPPAARIPRAQLERYDQPIMPVPGEVIDRFGERDAPGIVIAAAAGQAVAAPEFGRIVFAAPFKSYGLLLIIEHDREYHTLLWGLSRLDVAPGEQVRTGQIVGAMGQGREQAQELHVERRRHGLPVNPLPWLAASNSKVRG